MDLNSGHPYFLLKNGLEQVYQSLITDIDTDVAILGGGISGALVAHELVKQNINCCILDSRSIGLGSTCASTALLQYETDVPLSKLSKQIGEQDAIKAYAMCYKAITDLEKICNEVNHTSYTKCNSVYFAHSSSQNKFINSESEVRNQLGFYNEILTENMLSEKYRLDASSAIFSKHAAKIDAYALTHDLHSYNCKKTLTVFENTKVEQIEHSNNEVKLVTKSGNIIRAKTLIYANGYEAVKQIKRSTVQLRSTYATITKPIIGLSDVFKNTLFWNTDDPYLYIRESENRIIIGGRDEKFYDPAKRDKLIEEKAVKLIKDLEALFPQLEVEQEFSWTGTFGSTKDGLPYIGNYDKLPNSYFALGFGGNGIVFSVVAAQLITETILGNKNCIPEMFRFNR